MNLCQRAWPAAVSPAVLPAVLCPVLLTATLAAGSAGGASLALMRIRSGSGEPVLQAAPPFARVLRRSATLQPSSPPGSSALEAVVP